MKHTQQLFILCAKKRKGSTAYYEFQYCKADRPAGCEVLIPWRERAAGEFYGFYIMGI